MRSDVRDRTNVGRYWMPTLDGQLVRDCVVADEEEGYVEVYQVNEQGHRLIELPMVRLTGVVKLHPPEVWHALPKENYRERVYGTRERS